MRKQIKHIRHSWSNLRLQLLTLWAWCALGVFFPTVYLHAKAGRTQTATLPWFSELATGTGISKSNLQRIHDLVRKNTKQQNTFNTGHFEWHVFDTHITWCITKIFFFVQGFFCFASHMGRKSHACIPPLWFKEGWHLVNWKLTFFYLSICLRFRP